MLENIWNIFSRKWCYQKRLMLKQRYSPLPPRQFSNCRPHLGFDENSLEGSSLTNVWLHWLYLQLDSFRILWPFLDIVIAHNFQAFRTDSRSEWQVSLSLPRNRVVASALWISMKCTGQTRLSSFLSMWQASELVVVLRPRLSIEFVIMSQLPFCSSGDSQSFCQCYSMITIVEGNY